MSFCSKTRHIFEVAVGWMKLGEGQSEVLIHSLDFSNFLRREIIRSDGEGEKTEENKVCLL